MAKRVDIKNSQLVARTAYTKALQTIDKGNYCPFCNEKDLFKHHEEPILYRGSHWLATNNNWPYEGTAKHFLLIHHPHRERIEEVTPKAWADLHTAFKFLQKKFKLKGATLFIRTGELRSTGATVRHLHAQIVVGTPRTAASEPIRAVVGFKKKKNPALKQARG